MIARVASLIFASLLEGEVDSEQRRREGGMSPPSRKHPTCGDSTPLPDLPLKGGGAEEWRAEP
jgi:hypothetical protein